MSSQPAREVVDDEVVGYWQLTLEPVHERNGPGNGVKHETVVVGRLNGEALEPVEDVEERMYIEDELALNKGRVRFLDPGDLTDSYR